MRAGYSIPVELPGRWIEPHTRVLSRALRAALGVPASLWRVRDLVCTCLGRELAGRFRGSVLGFLWALVQPTLLYCIYGLVFTQLLGVRLPGVMGASGSSFGLYLFSGALVWASFAEGLTRGTSSLVDSRQLVARLAFPSEVLPLTAVLGALVTLMLAAAVTLGISWLGGVRPVPVAALCWLPALLLMQFALTYGIALAAAALHVYLRDTREFVTCALTLGMFVTPLFWVPSAQALPQLAAWLPLIEASPLYHLLGAWRHLLMSGTPEQVFQLPLHRHCLQLLPWSLGALLVGRAFFELLRPRLADQI